MVLSQLAASPGSGAARLIFLDYMISTSIQGLGLSDELLRHLKVEMCDAAMGMSSKTAAPIHTDTLLTFMFELLPYENSDKSEFSEERFHGFLSALADCGSDGWPNEGVTKLRYGDFSQSATA